MIRSNAQTARRWMGACRPIALALPIFLLLVVTMAVTAHAAVICVPNDAIDGSCTAGQGQLTIQAGINAAVSGVDTVLVGRAPTTKT